MLNWLKVSKPEQFKIKNSEGLELDAFRNQFKERFKKLQSSLVLLDEELRKFNTTNQISFKRATIARNVSIKQKSNCNILNEKNCCFMSCIIQALSCTKFRDLLFQNQYHFKCPILLINGFCPACDLKTVFLSLTQPTSIRITNFIENIEGKVLE